MEGKNASNSDLFLKYKKCIVESIKLVSLNNDLKEVKDKILKNVKFKDLDNVNDVLNILEKYLEDVDVKNSSIANIYNEILCELVFTEFKNEFERLERLDLINDLNLLVNKAKNKIINVSPAIKRKYCGKINTYYDNYLNNYVEKNYVRITLKLYNLNKENQNLYEYLRSIWPIDYELDNFIIKLAEKIIDRYLKFKPETINVMTVIKRKLHNGQKKWFRDVGMNYLDESKKQIKSSFDNEEWLNSLTKKERKEASELVHKYIDSKYEDIKTFCNEFEISEEKMEEILNIVRAKNNILYKEYLQKNANLAKKKYDSVLLHAKDIALKIVNGIETEEGLFRKFTYLDYKLNTDLTFDQFLKFLKRCNDIDALTLKNVRNFVNKYEKVKTFETGDVLDIHNIYCIDGYIFSVDERKAALNFMRNKGWSNDYLLFQQILETYKRGSLQLDINEGKNLIKK